MPSPKDPTKKHEVLERLGPKDGGILGDVTIVPGKYQGQPTLGPNGLAELDRHHFKTLLMASYNSKKDVHLWARLDYPQTVNTEFLKRYKELISGFAR